MNKLYFGDNLHILREHIKDETVDLIYLGSARVGQASPPDIIARFRRVAERRSTRSPGWSRTIGASGTLGSLKGFEF